MHQPQTVEIQPGRLDIQKKRHQAADFDSEKEPRAIFE